MKILSLFDGISCARVALERAGFNIEKYYASEIDKYAIQVALKNYPDTIQVGSVTELKGEDFKDIDLLIGGSPCQDLSIAKKDRQGLNGSRSGLFWEYVRLLKEVKPKYFVLENVASMPKEAKQVITEALGVEPIMINASLVSAQNRKRLFWTNIPNVAQPEDRGIYLKDILETNVDTKYVVNLSEKYGLKGFCEEYSKSKSLTASCYKGYGNDGVTCVTFRHRKTEPIRITKGGKCPTVQASWGTGGNNVPYIPTENKTGLYAISVSEQVVGRKRQPDGSFVRHLEPRKDNKSSAITSNLNRSLIAENTFIRKLTPIECERLQSLPDNYTEGVSNTQRYKCLGNAFNVEVVRHILCYLKS